MEIQKLASVDGYENNNTRALRILLLFNLGLRVGELCGLKWKDIENGQITVCRMIIEGDDEHNTHSGHQMVEYTKTESGNRTLPLSDEAKRILAKVKSISQLKGYPVGDDDYIFLRRTHDTITFCNQRSFDPRLRRYCDACGMGTIKSCHDVRRTVITRMYHKIVKNDCPDANLKMLQVFAGHSTLQQTLDYVRADSDDQLVPTELINSLYA